jgi:hypothetical protein
LFGTTGEEISPVEKRTRHRKSRLSAGEKLHFKRTRQQKKSKKKAKKKQKKSKKKKQTNTLTSPSNLIPPRCVNLLLEALAYTSIVTVFVTLSIRARKPDLHSVIE